jgi:hypothetical protein
MLDRKPKLDVSSSPGPGLLSGQWLIILQSLLRHQRQPCFSLRNGTFDRGFRNLQRNANAGWEALRQQGCRTQETVRVRACAQGKDFAPWGGGRRPQGRSECACHKYQHHHSTSGRHTAPPPAGCSLSDRPFRLSRCMCRCPHTALRAWHGTALVSRHPCPFVSVCTVRVRPTAMGIDRLEKDRRRRGRETDAWRARAALGKALPCLPDMTASWCYCPARSPLAGQTADPLWWTGGHARRLATPHQPASRPAVANHLPRSRLF